MCNASDGVPEFPSQFALTSQNETVQEAQSDALGDYTAVPGLELNGRPVWRNSNGINFMWYNGNTMHTFYCIYLIYPNLLHVLCSRFG